MSSFTKQKSTNWQPYIENFKYINWGHVRERRRQFLFVDLHYPPISAAPNKVFLLTFALEWLKQVHAKLAPRKCPSLQFVYKC